MTREEINRYISKLEEKIKLASIATRLSNNPDFNSVFITEYFGTYPLSLVKELSQHIQGSGAALIIEDKLFCSADLVSNSIAFGISFSTPSAVKYIIAKLACATEL